MRRLRSPRLLATERARVLVGIAVALASDGLHTSGADETRGERREARGERREGLMLAWHGHTGVCSGKRLRSKIKQLTGRPITSQTLIYLGKPIKLEDTVEAAVGQSKLASGSILITCFPRPTTEEEEAEAMSLGERLDDGSSRGDPRLGGGGMAMLQGAASGRGGGIGAGMGLAPGRGLGAIGGSGLMSMDDDGRSDGGDSRGSGSTGRGAGLSQDLADDDWEAVGKKKKAAKGGGGGGAGAAGMPYGSTASCSAGSAPAQALDKQQGGAKARDGKMHFFGLWVGNVHSQVVEQDELRACFERFGELCNSKAHGVPPINILPDSSSAFVNFCRYEDADAARNALQGRTVAGTGLTPRPYYALNPRPFSDQRVGSKP